METCIRGFSFMPDKVDVVDLQYIEEGELERTWKSTRRERQKQREQKIWEEFVKENDIVNSVYEDDQYQFLDQLPDTYVKEVMEADLQKLKDELKASEETKVQVEEPSLTQIYTGERAQSDPEDQQPCVTFADDIEDNDCPVFHIFDGDKDEESGGDEGAANESMGSPPTVRERCAGQLLGDASPERASTVNTSSTDKSSENVGNVIESSIYCAKVKDLRIKINDEILEIICSFDRRDIFSMEREDIARMIKRSAEFCTRFNRIYMYQLQRQMQDIKRNSNVTLPFAKHTQFQSQMIRVVSVHQNLLQAFQVFHKAVEHTWCDKDSVAALKALVGAARALTDQCRSLPQPRHLPPAHTIYSDSVLSSCDKLEEFVNQYIVRCEQFLNGFGKINTEDKKRKDLQKLENNKSKKRPIPQRTNSKTISDSDARLSMYSFDTLRLNPKKSNSRNMPPSTSRASAVDIYSNKVVTTDKNETSKSPKSRRPLMRDPAAGQPRAARTRTRARDGDVRTLVEQVARCSSRDSSLEVEVTSRPKAFTPRSARKELHSTARKSQQNTPRKNRQLSPKTPKIKSTLNTILNNKGELENLQLIPVNKIQSSKKKKASKKEKEFEMNLNSEDANMTARLNSPKLKSPEPEPVTYRSQIANTSKPPSPKVHIHVERNVSPKPSSNSGLPVMPIGEKKEKNKVVKPQEQCEVTKILKQLCSGDASGARPERSCNAKNAQLLYVNDSSPRSQPSTPQLLRILEETIQKKIPKSLQKKYGPRDIEKYRLNFIIPEKVTENLFQYRTKFVQHMLASPMYANSAVGKPWEMIGSVSEQIIDEVILNCAKDMELSDVLQELYKQETT